MAEAEKKKKSIKTTIGGWASLLGLILVGISALLDGNPETNPDGAAIAQALQTMGIATTGIGATVIGFFARDDKVKDADVEKS